MPLIAPGLDEAAVKVLSKRLLKSLKKQQGELSLNNMQNLLVQALGHKDLYAAQKYWKVLKYNKLKSGAHMLGHWSLLETAMAHVVSGVNISLNEDHEQNEGVRSLCFWRNRLMDSSRAECFYLGLVDKENEEVSILGYSDCPPWSFDDWGKYEYALFEEEGRPTVALLFLRGRQENSYINNMTNVYAATGKLMWKIGVPLEDVDEAYYSIAGLQQLKGMVDA